MVLGALVLGGTGLGVALGDAGASTDVAGTANCSASTPKLTVQGTGQANATPDMLTAVLQVSVTAPSAQAALAQNNAKVSDVEFALSGNGVVHKDVATTDLTIEPQYAYPHNVPTITGYMVVDTLTATMHAVDKAGAALDAVVGATGNAVQITSLAFSFDHPAQVESQARALAVSQAVRHARAMAHAAGRRLGPVCTLTDNTTPPLPAAQDQTFATAGLGAVPQSAGSPVPLEAGTQSESDQVTVVYAISR